MTVLLQIRRSLAFGVLKEDIMQIMLYTVYCHMQFSVTEDSILQTWPSLGFETFESRHWRKGYYNYSLPSCGK